MFFSYRNYTISRILVSIRYVHMNQTIYRKFHYRFQILHYFCAISMNQMGPYILGVWSSTYVEYYIEVGKEHGL
jgi:hypothetical protein